MDKTQSAIIILLACIAVAFAAALILENPGPKETPAGAVSTGIPAGTISAPATSPGISADCSPVTITQTDGKQVTLPCAPKRIIAANANAAELLLAMGAGDMIVGVTDSTLPVTYIMDKIPGAVSIGNWQTPNIEQMLALHPDVVIAYSSSKPKNIDQITAANITIVTLDAYKLSTLASDARSLGAISNRRNEAEVYARMVEDTIADVKTRVQKIPKNQYPSVYFEMYTDYTAAAQESGAHEIIVGAGGKNIAETTLTSSTKVSAEWIVAQKPEYIFKVVSTSNTKSLEEIVNDLRARPGSDTIPAVQQQHVHAFANDIVYGPRAYIGLVYTAQLLHPAEFRDMHPRAMLAEYDTKYVAGTNRTGMIYP